MRILYTLLIHLYVRALRLAAAFHPKARKWVRGRRNWLENMPDIPDNRMVVWLHAASLGEFEQGRPVMEALKAHIPDVYLFISFFSPSGYEVRKNYEGADGVSYLPSDTPSNARRWVQKLCPDLLILVKYEVWPNFLIELEKRNTPTLLISALFRKNQVYFGIFGSIFQQRLRRMTHIFTQNQSSSAVLDKQGFSNHSVAGDTRFDRVIRLREESPPLPEIEAFTRGKKTFVVGSSWPEDMNVLHPFIGRHYQQCRFIIAPHEIAETRISKLQLSLPGVAVRYSEWKEGTAADILIIDSIGLLSHIYRYGDFAWVGGSFGDGLHNILEPATFGMPVFFGNGAHVNFPEALDLIDCGGAFAINNTAELEEAFLRITSGDRYRDIARICSDYVTENSGATPKIMKEINNILTR